MIDQDFSVKKGLKVFGNALRVSSSLRRVGINIDEPRSSLDVGNNTDGIIFPKGTTEQRPTNNIEGMFRLNTTTGNFEGYSNSNWRPVLLEGSVKDADFLNGQPGLYYRNASNLNAGIVPEAQIPSRIGYNAYTISNWNTATYNGWFYSDANSTNSPTTNKLEGFVVSKDSSNFIQTVWELLTTNTAKTFRRKCIDGSFTAWERVYAGETETDNRYLQINNYTPQSILTRLLTVDGADSGLDADLLDGQQGAYYLPASLYTDANFLSKFNNISGTNADLLDGKQGSEYYQKTDSLDADTLNGKQGSQYYLKSDNVNAYTLNGKQGSYYQNAGNLTGTLSPDRLSGNYSFGGLTLTNGLTLINNGINIGSVLASSLTDLSKHINLGFSRYGFNITSNTLNIISSNGSGFVDTIAKELRVNGEKVTTISNYEENIYYGGLY